MSQKNNFIQQHQAAVINACAGTNLYPSVKMAQMILESGRGGSWLATNANNYFGIKKGVGWTGKTVNRTDKADNYGKGSNDAYRVYTNVEDNIRDHTAFLQKNKRYTTHGVFRAESPRAQAQALAQAGYAASNGYADKIMGVINSNNLTKLDTLQPTNPQKANAPPKSNLWLWLAGIAGGLLLIGGGAYCYLYFSTKNRV